MSSDTPAAPSAVPESDAGSRPLSRLIDGYFAPAPATRPAVLRILVGAYALAALAIEAPEHLRVATRPEVRFDPVGPWVLLDTPLAPTVARLVLATAFAAGVAFVLGWRFRVSGPAFAALFLAVTAYRSSWGQIFHTENLAALHLLVLGLSRSADAWSLDWRAGRARRAPPATGYGWSARLMMGLAVATYFLAGVAKLRIGGSAWLDGDALAHQVAFDNLRKILVGDVASPLAGFALDHLWIFGPFALFSLAVELGAPIALWRPARVAWVIAAWLFHVGILALMAIVFAYPLTGIAFACFFPVERGASWLVDDVRTRRAARTQTRARAR